MQKNRTIILVDGENLITRYETMLGKGSKPGNHIIHENGKYIWHNTITQLSHMDIIRVSYYTTCIGDDQTLIDLNKKISEIEYKFQCYHNDSLHKGRIVPHVYKKTGRSTKTKSVDINITIDALRHTYNNSIDTLLLMSGDGDYIPLIQEVMRQGKKVIVGALSNGLNPQLSYIADNFINLDKWMVQ